jgi:hypothetical protein
MSDNVEFFSGDFPIAESLCFTCEHRASRVIVPLDPEAIGLDSEALENLGVGEDESIRIEQHTCIILMQDMDYIVTECNKFALKGLGKTPNLLRHDIK